MDEILRMIAEDGHIKVMAITATGLVERARQIHSLAPLATAALGRALMACSMMGRQLKEVRGSVTLSVRGGGPLGTITVVSDCEGNVRGYLPDGSVELPLKVPGKLDVGAGVGKSGTLTVIKDLGMKEPYIGTVPLVSGEIAEDVTSYFFVSEQIPTACALGVLVERDYRVSCAGGYLIQLLPGATDGEIAAVEKGIARLGAITPALAGGMDAEAVLREVLGSFALTVLDHSPVEYRCYCSRERITQALISMGPDELREMIEEDGKAELTCQFCNKAYHFTKQELESFLL